MSYSLSAFCMSILAHASMSAYMLSL
jgi:hypothetical protein